MYRNQHGRDSSMDDNMKSGVGGNIRTDGSYGVDEYELYYYLILLFIIIGVIKSYHIVPPGKRRVFINIMNGKVFVVEKPGFCFFPFITWKSFGQGPFLGLVNSGSSYDMPAPSTKLSIDPNPTPVHTMEGIPCTIDIKAEAIVLPWDYRIIEETGLYSQLSITRINDWLARIIGTVPADKMNYPFLSPLLNSKEELGELNRSIAQVCALRIERINFDPSGIVLSKAYSGIRETINSTFQSLEAKEKEILKKTEIQELENKLQRSIKEAEIERESLVKFKEIEIEKLQQKYLQDHIKILTSSGLGASNITQIIVAGIGANALRQTPNVNKIMCVPPSMVGLHVQNDYQHFNQGKGNEQV